MTKLRRRIGTLPLAALALLVVGGVGVFAQRNYMVRDNAPARQPDVRVALAGAVERAGARVALDKAGEVHPGEILAWTITSANEGDGAAREFKTIGQIPAGTVLVANSVTADGAATVTYSIDHGKTFTAQPMVETKQADGTTKRVPAPISMYTQVRYEWSDAFAAGGKLTAAYKVRVK
jgi:uncharacterized repeat protein (TIGR01451 family)